MEVRITVEAKGLKVNVEKTKGMRECQERWK